MTKVEVKTFLVNAVFFAIGSGSGIVITTMLGLETPSIHTIAIAGTMYCIAFLMGSRYQLS